MKLTGAGISPALLVSRIGERLRARGLAPQPRDHAVDELDEAPMDPWLGFLEQLWRNAEPADALPYNPGDSQVKRLVFQALRLPLQPAIEELFGSQRRFNRSATESYAHLAAELKRLRAEVETLRAQVKAQAEASQAPSQSGSAGDGETSVDGKTAPTSSSAKPSARTAGTAKAAPRARATKAATKASATRPAPKAGATKAAPKAGATKTAPKAGATKTAPKAGATKAAPKEKATAPPSTKTGRRS